MDTSFADLINRWPKPSLTTFARDIGITVEHASAMKQRNSIPSAHWLNVVRAAEDRGVDGVTLGRLAELAAARREQPSAAA